VHVGLALSIVDELAADERAVDERPADGEEKAYH
jgi:hydrogenase maturation factor